MWFYPATASWCIYPMCSLVVHRKSHKGKGSRHGEPNTSTNKTILSIWKSITEQEKWTGEWFCQRQTQLNPIALKFITSSVSKACLQRPSNTPHKTRNVLAVCQNTTRNFAVPITFSISCPLQRNCVLAEAKSKLDTGSPFFHKMRTVYALSQLNTAEYLHHHNIASVWPSQPWSIC